MVIDGAQSTGGVIELSTVVALLVPSAIAAHVADATVGIAGGLASASAVSAPQIAEVMMVATVRMRIHVFD